MAAKMQSQANFACASCKRQSIELQTAKEILAEIFRARPEDVEDMIQRRLEEKSRCEEHEWPAAFWSEVNLD